MALPGGLAIFVVPPLLYFVLPESPRWYLRRGRVEAAVDLVNHIIRRVGSRVPALGVSDLGDLAPAAARERLPPYWALFRRGQLRWTAIGISAYVFQSIAFFLTSGLLPKALVDQGAAVADAMPNGKIAPETAPLRPRPQGGRGSAQRGISKYGSVEPYSLSRKATWCMDQVSLTAQFKTGALARASWSARGSRIVLVKRFAAADTLVHIDLPLFIHFRWVTDRLIKGLFADTPGWPENSPLWSSSMQSYRVLWLCRRHLTPKYRQLVGEEATSKRVHHLKAPAQIKMNSLLFFDRRCRGAAGRFRGLVPTGVAGWRRPVHGRDEDAGTRRACRQALCRQRVLGRQAGARGAPGR